MAIIFIPTQMQDITAGISQVEIEAKNLKEVIEKLESRFPGIRQRLCQKDRLNPSIAASIDSEVTTHSILTKVQANSEIHFLPAIGGG